MILDLIDLAASAAYVVLITLGLYRTRRTASLPDLDRAIELLLWAAFASFVSVIAGVVLFDRHGWLPLVISGAALVATVVTICRTVVRADRMEADR